MKMKTPLLLLRRKDVEARTGLARSTIYKMVSSGHFPPPIRLFGSAVGWPSGEVDAVNMARIYGKSEDEIRLLVAQIKADRTAGAPQQGGDHA